MCSIITDNNVCISVDFKQFRLTMRSQLYIHTYIHTHTYTYIYIYIYIYIYKYGKYLNIFDNNILFCLDLPILIYKKQTKTNKQTTTKYT